MIEFFLFAGAVYLIFRTNVFFKARSEVASYVKATWSADANAASARFGIPASLILAEICVESGGVPDAKNLTGTARGLMQMEEGALSDSNRYAGTSFTFDEMFNGPASIMAGTGYLAWLRDELGGDTSLVVQSYEGGIGNVRKSNTYAAWYRDRVFAYQNLILNS